MHLGCLIFLVTDLELIVVHLRNSEASVLVITMFGRVFMLHASCLHYDVSVGPMFL